MNFNHTLHADPTDWQADLDQFRAACATQRRVIDGHVWEYIRCGVGAQSVLILPGGLAVAETAFRYIRRLAPHYHVLAPTYPETITTIAQLVDGLAKLVQAEQIARIHVVGGSYSGLVAQCLVRHAPKLVEKLVLADTGVPRRSRAMSFALYQPLLAYAPLGVVRGLFCAVMAVFALKLPAQRAFWWRYFRQRIAGMTRAAFLSHLSAWRDFDRSYQFSAHDLASWCGQLLIIEAEHDQLFRRSERTTLHNLYPFAQLHTFAHSSHGASLARMDDYIAVIERFLAEDKMTR